MQPSINPEKTPGVEALEMDPKLDFVPPSF
jgi:hypothetical protein